MIVTKKTIPRRTILRGLGTALALPLLDNMIPALTALSKTAGGPIRRYSIVYAAHGYAPGQWLPTAEGRDFELTAPMRALAPYRDQMLLVTGIDNDAARQQAGDPRGGHGRMVPAFMSGVHAKPTQGTDFEAAITIDQIAANHMAGQTTLPSLQLSLDSPAFAGTCDSGYSCAYTNTMSWRGATLPLPMENNPRAVFERLFGDSGSTDPTVRLQRIREKRSILDSVLQKASKISNESGPSDRRRFDEYMESIRDVEQRIQTAEEQNGRELAVVEQPHGIPGTFTDHAHLMFDLLTLAYEADLTRISTFMMAKEVNQRTYPELGVSEGHHAISHHGNVASKIADLAKVNAYHLQTFAYFLEKLKNKKDGPGSLLDHSIVLFGSGHGNANIHEPKELPIVVLGGGAGQLTNMGRHIRYHERAQLADLHVTLLNKFGVPIERLGTYGKTEVGLSLT